MNKLLILIFAAIVIVASCNPTEKKNQVQEKEEQQETFGHVYSADGNQTLKITYIDSASIKYHLTYEVPDTAANCKGEVSGVAVYLNPEADLETDEDEGSAYPVEEFVHETSSYYLTIRLRYPERDRARVQLDPLDKTICPPSDSVMVKQQVQ